MDATISAVRREPWNKGKLVGQKAPLKVKDIWAICVRLQIQLRTRDLAVFDLGIDSKLRGCDLVKLRVRDVCHGDRVASRAVVLQQKHNDRSSLRSRLRRERRRSMDQVGGTPGRRLSVPESTACVAAPRHAAIRSHCGRLGQRDRP